jgi:bacillithiol biosynthesis deacetylase BshB1
MKTAISAKGPKRVGAPDAAAAKLRAQGTKRGPQGPFDVVVFGPHPDDVEMVIAGTVLRLTDAGKRVLNVSLTRGEMGTFGTPETRALEFAAACRILGCEGLLLDFPDTRVANDPEGRLKIARVVRRHRPAVVFAPYHTNRFGHLDGSANVDHPATGAVVRDGLKLARFRNVLPELPPHEVSHLYYYMVPKDLLPTIIVDVTPVIDRARAAIRAYATQMSIRKRENEIFELLDTIRRYHGLRIGRPFGEAFLSDESLPFGPLEFFGPRPSA